MLNDSLRWDELGNRINRANVIVGFGEMRVRRGGYCRGLSIGND